MITAIERIQDIVDRHELDVVVIYASDGAKLDYVEGSTDDLKTAIGCIPESFDGVVTVEAYRATRGTVRGKKADADKPFRWKVQGRAPMAAAPPAQAAPPVVREVKVPDLETVKEAADSRADARVEQFRREAAEREAAELRGRLALLEEDQDDDQDDDDQDDDDMGALPWYKDKDATLEMIGALRDLFKPSAPQVPATNGVSDRERQILHAFRRFQAASPEQATATTEALLKNFGDSPAPQPEPDGDSEGQD